MKDHFLQSDFDSKFDSAHLHTAYIDENGLILLKISVGDFFKKKSHFPDK